MKRSIRALAPCVVVLAGLVASCGSGAGASNARVATVKPPASAASPHEAPAPVVADAPRASSPIARDDASLPPVDEAFLSAPLPDAGPPLATFRETSRITVGKGYLYDVALLPEGLVATFSDEDGKVRVYDLRHARLVATFAVPGFARFAGGAIAAFPGERPRIVAASKAGLFLVDARTGAVEARVSAEPFRHVRFSPDERVLVAVQSFGIGGPSQNSKLSFFERQGSELRLVRTMPFGERVDGVDLSRDHRLLAVTLYPSNSLQVLDLAKPEGERERFRVQGPRYASDCSFSPDGRLVAVGGQGVLVVDLVNSDRRAFYGKFKNNVGRVRFSPSGDALVASSYDSRLRAFAVEGPDTQGLRLSLLKELRHADGANVYGFAFTADGASLVSGSGDRTLRTFEGDRSKSRSGDREPRRFRSVDAWAREAPELLRSPPPADLGTIEGGQYVLPAFRSPRRPARIRPGRYDCKITAIYKLRECTVELDADGRTVLTFHSGNLLSLRGVLYDDGPVVRYEAALLSKASVIDCEGCDRQPLEGFFRGQGNQFEGLLTFRTVYDRFTRPERPPPTAPIEEGSDRFPLTLRYRGPL